MGNDNLMQGLVSLKHPTVRLVTTTHADDMYTWVGRDEDLEWIAVHLKHYQNVSGARVNFEKSRIFNLDIETATITMKSLGTRMQQDDGNRVFSTNLRVSEMKSNEEQQPEEDEIVEKLKILGVCFNLMEDGWKENWQSWQQRSIQQIDTWRDWRLSTGQKVKYFVTYCIPAGNFLASVYPPPEKTMKAVIKKLFVWFYGRATFLLARVVSYQQQKNEKEAGGSQKYLQHGHAASPATLPVMDVDSGLQTQDLIKELDGVVSGALTVVEMEGGPIEHSGKGMDFPQLLEEQSPEVEKNSDRKAEEFQPWMEYKTFGENESEDKGLDGVMHPSPGMGTGVHSRPSGHRGGREKDLQEIIRLARNPRWFSRLKINKRFLQQQPFEKLNQQRKKKRVKKRGEGRIRGIQTNADGKPGTDSSEEEGEVPRRSRSVEAMRHTRKNCPWKT
uniref:Uncharacterized protein n=1 Tax=Sphaerodactylus townsendi TaxID=933632 RepID=A0ACB8F954_9SAUR